MRSNDDSSLLSTMKLRQNGGHFSDDVFKWIFSNHFFTLIYRLMADNIFQVGLSLLCNMLL